MAAGLAAHMSGLSLTTRSKPVACSGACHLSGVGRSHFLQGQGLSTGSSRPGRCTAAGALVIVAAQNAKKRQRTAERQRQYNKARRSAVGTRSKKVTKTLADFNLRLPEAESDLKPVDVFIAEAYKEIDKAVQKGILHKNTGARRKSKLALARQKLLIKAGLYTPATPAAQPA